MLVRRRYGPVSAEAFAEACLRVQAMYARRSLAQSRYFWERLRMETTVFSFGPWSDWGTVIQGEEDEMPVEMTTPSPLVAAEPPGEPSEAVRAATNAPVNPFPSPEQVLAEAMPTAIVSAQIQAQSVTTVGETSSVPTNPFPTPEQIVAQEMSTTIVPAPLQPQPPTITGGTSTQNAAAPAPAQPPLTLKQRLKTIREDMEQKFARLRVEPTTTIPTSPAFMHRQCSNGTVESYHSCPSATRRSTSSSPVQPVREAAPSCIICLGPCSVQVRNICPKQCEGGNMCAGCSSKFWKSWIKDNRYVVTPPRCVGCKSHIMPDTWRTVVKEKDFAQYLSNLTSQFVVRCPYCDQDTDFCYAFETVTETAAAEKLEKIEAMMFSAQEELREFHDAMEAFLAYEPRAAVRVVNALEAGLGPEVARWALVPSLFRTADEKQSTTELDAAALTMLTDIERRCTLQLEYFRREQARVSTSCCSAPICFACKYGDGWHENETCQDVMERTWIDAPVSGEDKLFQCPSCHVTCIHAGGCSSIRCICGFEYSLQDVSGGWDA